MGELLKTVGTILGLFAAGSAVIGGVISGILYVLGYWKRGKNDEGERLIGILQDTVTTLEKKVDDQKKEHDEILTDFTKQMEQLTKKVDHLEKENETLRDVLQGRDEQTQKFYKKAFESMELAGETHQLIKTMSKTQTDLMKVLVDNLKPNVVVNNQTPPPAPAV